MNAYELADAIQQSGKWLKEEGSFEEPAYVTSRAPYKAAEMLRQQAKRIEELEKCMVKSSGLLFNYKYELELERAMSAQLREELEKYK